MVNKDTDGDGVLDWEEGLWGTDPNKTETTPGIRDDAAINKIKEEEVKNGGKEPYFEPDQKKLTETDKFSRELFSTIVTLNQNGTMDQATIDALSISLAEQIQNLAPKKIFALADIKIINDESVEAIQNYRETLLNIYEKNTTTKRVPDIMEELINDEENMSILLELDQVISKSSAIINELVKIKVPRSLALLHLDLINISERLVENINGIKFIDKDPILAIGAVSQYFKNSNDLELITNRLISTIQQKLPQ